MIEANQETRENEQRVGEFHKGEATQVAGVHQVGENAEEREPHREPVEDNEQDLDCNDAVDQATQESASENGMFLDELR